MAPPGQIQRAAHRQAAYNATRSFELKADPRVLKDGVTQADLDEQFAFQIKVRDALNDARRLAAARRRGDEEGRRARAGSGDAGRPAPWTRSSRIPLQKLWAQLNDLPGIYPQPMLISQLQNVQRMVGQADQKVGKDAVDRFNDLTKELQALQAELQKVSGSM